MAAGITIQIIRRHDQGEHDRAGPRSRWPTRNEIRLRRYSFTRRRPASIRAAGKRETGEPEGTGHDLQSQHSCHEHRGGPGVGMFEGARVMPRARIHSRFAYHAAAISVSTGVAAETPNTGSYAGPHHDPAMHADERSGDSPHAAQQRIGQDHARCDQELPLRANT